MIFKVAYTIGCGVSPGFGVTYADKVKRNETIEANTPGEAVAEAKRLAIHFGKDYLSNPDTGNTSVTLDSIVQLGVEEQDPVLNQRFEIEIPWFANLLYE